MVGNIHKWLGNVYGNAAFSRRAVDHCAKKSDGWRTRKSAATLFSSSQKHDGDSVLGL